MIISMTNFIKIRLIQNSRVAAVPMLPFHKSVMIIYNSFFILRIAQNRLYPEFIRAKACHKQLLNIFMYQNTAVNISLHLAEDPSNLHLQIILGQFPVSLFYLHATQSALQYSTCDTPFQMSSFY